MKFIVMFSAVLAVAIAKPSGYLAPITYAAPIVAAPVALSSQHHAQDTLGQYTYGYSNPLSSKTEVRSLDGITRGGYSYIDAEGKLQSVQYVADPINGFRVSATNLPMAPAAPEAAAAAPETPLVALPVPVQDTPEVAEAKAKHLAIVEAAKARTPTIAAPIYPYGYNAPILGYSYPYSHAYPYSHYYHPYSYSYPFHPAAYTLPATLPTGVSHTIVSHDAPAVPEYTPEVAKARAEHFAAIEEAKARDA